MGTCVHAGTFPEEEVNLPDFIEWANNATPEELDEWLRKNAPRPSPGNPDGPIRKPRRAPTGSSGPKFTDLMLLAGGVLGITAMLRDWPGTIEIFATMLMVVPVVLSESEPTDDGGPR